MVRSKVNWKISRMLGLVNDPVKETGVRPTSIQASRIFRPPLQEAELEPILNGLLSEVVERMDDLIPKTLHIMFYTRHGEASHSRQIAWPRLHNTPCLNVQELAHFCLTMLRKSGFKPPFAFIQIGAKDLEEPGGIGWDKDAVNDYFFQSRLHFMGTWIQRYLQYMPTVEDSGDWGVILPFDTAIVIPAKSLLSLDESSEKHPVFLLIDMDCFFCSVALSMEPTIEDTVTPVAVCSGMGPTSEVSSANYPTRARGVRAGSFVRTAQASCPELKILRITPALLAKCEVTWKNRSPPFDRGAQWRRSWSDIWEELRRSFCRFDRIGENRSSWFTALS